MLAADTSLKEKLLTEERVDVTFPTLLHHQLSSPTPNPTGFPEEPSSWSSRSERIGKGGQRIPETALTVSIVVHHYPKYIICRKGLYLHNGPKVENVNTISQARRL